MEAVKKILVEVFTLGVHWLYVKWKEKKNVKKT